MKPCFLDVIIHSARISLKAMSYVSLQLIVEVEIAVLFLYVLSFITELVLKGA